MTPTQIDAEAESLLKFLRSIRDDRGAMANLRSLWIPAREFRAWPLLARAGALKDSPKRAIAGLYALHPIEAESGNMGDACGLLAKEHRSFDVRFQRLLSCTREELPSHLRRVVMAAAQNQIKINHKQLFVDFYYWGVPAKLRWTQSFFNVYKPEDL